MIIEWILDGALLPSPFYLLMYTTTIGNCKKPEYCKTILIQASSRYLATEHIALHENAVIF